MDEHELLLRLKSRIGSDMTPVRPLMPPARQAIWLLTLWIALAMGVLLTLGPRSDINVLGVWRSVGFSLLEVGVCLVLARISLRSAIPAMSASLGTAVAWLVIAACLHLFISWATLEQSDLSPPQGEKLSDGLRCLALIVFLALAPLAAGAMLLVRGLLERYVVPFVLMAFAAGLAAEATWRLHCPYSAWDHVLLFHSDVLLLLAFVAAGTALYVQRNRHFR